jgi:Carboxypeptidase regulatory-like domain
VISRLIFEGRPRQIARFAILASMLPLEACLPAEITEMPALHGRVVDATTGAPVPGARVTAESSAPGAGSTTVTTAEDGRFAAAPRSHTEWLWIGTDVIDLAVMLKLEAPGYVTATVTGYPPDELPDPLPMKRADDTRSTPR